MEEGGDAVKLDQGHAILVCGYASEGVPEVNPANRDPTVPAVAQAPEYHDRTTSTGALLALAQQVLRGEGLKPEDLEVILLILRFAEDPRSVTSEIEMRLKEIYKDQRSSRCPINSCWKQFLRRDDLVKHVRKPTGGQDATSLKLHHELDVKYQGMELICCGETQTNFGVLVKHLKSHRGT